MSRQDKGHQEEELNLRSFYLRLCSRIWVLPLGALLGALLCGGIYFLITVVLAPAPDYQASSMLYVDFAYDETGTVVDYYNAYTWNDLVMTDDICGPTLEKLAEEGFEADKALLREATDVSLPSDIRLMKVTITASSPELADAINEATDASLVAFGRNMKEFTAITIRAQDPAERTAHPARLLTSAAAGAVLGLLITIFGWMLMHALDDAVYVPEDVEKRYHQPVVGVISRKGTTTPDRFRNETIAGWQELSGLRKIGVIHLADLEGSARAEEAVTETRRLLGSNVDFASLELTAFPIPGTTPDSYRNLRDTDGVVLCLDQGRRNGVMAEHVISQLSKHQCNLLGIQMTDCDMKFMSRYYRV